MTTRNLELNLRARADTRDLERLSRETLELASNLRKSSAAFDEANADARKLAQTFGQLSQEEREQIQSASRVATAVSQAAAARERAAKAAADAAAAESRALGVQQQAEGAAFRTAAAQERLASAQANTVSSVSRAAAAEEKLAQERQRTLQATSKTEKEEIAVARAREQLRAATARAEQAERRMAETRKSSGLAADIVRKQFQALLAGGVILEVGRQMLQFGRDTIMAASDAEEASAKFDQVFGTLSGSVRDELELMADSNRRSIYDLVSFASTLQDTFVPLGFAREEAAELSKSVTQLGIDIAAFSNKADDEVIHNLTSAIVGNHEAVRSYGIVLTETVLKQELARMGALELTGTALELAKAQARVNIIMRASADAQGAAVREAGSYANTLKAWDAAIQELKVSLGTGLLPMMTELVEIAIKAAEIIGGQQDDALREANANALELVDTHSQVMQLARETAAQADAQIAQSYRNANVANPTIEALDNIIIKLAETSGSTQQFQSDIAYLGIDLLTLARIFRDLGIEGGFTDYDDLAQKIFAAANAQKALADATQSAAEANERNRQIGYAYIDQLVASTQDIPKAAQNIQTFSDRAISALSAYADEITRTKQATEEARQAQIAWNQAFGESFRGAPVDDLIAAQQDLRAATGEWRTATIDNSGDIAAIQRQLAADLTAEQKKELQKQLKDLDSFSAEYMAIVDRLEGDLSDSQRFDLSQQLAALEQRQGQASRAYTGDVEAAEEAREAIIAANQAIQDSYYERAYNSIAARLIEEGNFAQLADVAVSLGIMSQEEANLRMQYAETTAALDTLTQSTEFYGLTAAQQAGAIKSLAAGIYETAQAALTAQQNLQATQDFFSTAPTSDQIGNYYRDLSQQSGADDGITTTVGVVIDPASMIEFRGYRTELEDYDAAIYETTVLSHSGDAERDFRDMKTSLDDLTKEEWVIKIRYETTGDEPGTPTTGTSDPDDGDEPRNRGRRNTPSGAYVDLTVNNYGGGDVAGAVKTGVLAAFRSL